MKLQDITPDEIKIIILIAGVFAAGLVILAQRASKEPAPYLEKSAGSAAQETAGESYVVVDVSGAVWRPGVYTLSEGARVGEALDMAMLRPDADIDGVNRARVLYDGEKLVVPSSAGESRAASEAAGDARVNINSADVDELRSLPSIGESRARDIIDYRRRHGPFSSADELRNIPGIGEATLERLRERVTVR